ncbi:MAG: OmpA family protein [Alphaproteobacteria bacterium]|nr:OmpA family protein [Alphaproteobacteria bacterium]
MTSLSVKTAALVALGALAFGSAQAGVLHTMNGVPVLTTGGSPVLTGANADEEVAARPAVPPTADYIPPKPKFHKHAVYFEFNKTNLTPRARHELDHLVKRLNRRVAHGHKRPVVMLFGFADRVGNATYNEKLALKRARSVHDYLLAEGIKAKKIEVRSLGKSDAGANCPADMSRGKLIDCLSKDRRVEIQIAD